MHLLQNMHIFHARYLQHCNMYLYFTSLEMSVIIFSNEGILYLYNLRYVDNKKKYANMLYSLLYIY